MIAALYVDRTGPYWDHPLVDPWDEARDARLYAGPHPVVAHPPCAAWCRWAWLRERDFGLIRGDDGGTFVAALDAVRHFGGVLEHPAHSAAWDHYGLEKPRGGYWTRGLLDPGWVCEVDQALYDHPSRKVTWLYYVGPDPEPVALGRGAVTRGPKQLSKRLRRLTPAPFAEALISLAS